jgi:hypothetical protein
MPRGYRCVLIALVGLALAGAGPPNQSAKPQQSQTNQAGSAPSAYKPDPNRNAETCYQNPDHEAADLCAQWSAADAAKETANLAYWGNWISGAAAALSFLSIILVLFALKQGREANVLTMKEAARNTRRAVDSAEDTRKALAAAERSAKASAALVRVAAKTARQQLRAYLDFDGIGWLRDEARDEPEQVMIGVHYSVKNFGHTPAKDVIATMKYLMRKKDGEAKYLGEATEILGHLAPTDHVTKNAYFPVAPWIWTKIGEREFILIVEISVHYADDFKRKHTLGSSFESNGHVNIGFVIGTRVST